MKRPSLRCYSVLVGASRPNGKKRFSKREEKLIQELTARHFENGFSILDANGGWYDPERKRFIQEESRQILVCPSSRAELRRWATELANALQQKELLVVELGPAHTVRNTKEKARSKC